MRARQAVQADDVALQPVEIRQPLREARVRGAAARVLVRVGIVPAP